MTGPTEDLQPPATTEQVRRAYTTTTSMPADPEKPGVLMHEDGYQRIQGRIKKEMGRWSPPLWLGIAMAFFGVGVSALLAYLVLPKHATGLPAGASAIIATIAIASGVLTVGFTVVFLVVRHRGSEAAQDICDEMDTHCIRDQVASNGAS